MDNLTRLVRPLWRLFQAGLLALVLLLLLSAAVNGHSALTPVHEGDDFESDQVVVKLNLSSGATITDINATYGTTTREALLPSAGIYLLQLPPGHSGEQEVSDQMEHDPRVLYAEPNFIGEAPEADPSNIYAWGGGDDPRPLDAQYARKVLDLDWAQDIGRGEDVVVAVIDTGVVLSHPQLMASLTVTRYDFVDDDPVPEDAFNGLDDDGDGRVDEAAGHGTHVAGIIHMTAPAARIMPLRVLDSDGRGNIFVIAEAMLYAAQNGADVINLSLGTTRQSDLLKEVVEDVVEEGVVVVAAAGNLNSDVAQYPAAEEKVLAVTSVGPTGTKSLFANYGDWVDVAAPGESIYSTFPLSGYAYWSGTSMAAPFVAGQAALIYSVAPGLAVEDVERLIRQTARSLDALNPAYAGLLGAGQADIGASVGCHWADVWPDAQHDILNNSCDGMIGVNDLVAQAAAWRDGSGDALRYDNNRDGVVNIIDLQRVAARWGWSRR